MTREEIELPPALERHLATLELQTRSHHRRLWDALHEVTKLLAEQLLFGTDPFERRHLDALVRTAGREACE